MDNVVVIHRNHYKSTDNVSLVLQIKSSIMVPKSVNVLLENYMLMENVVVTHKIHYKSTDNVLLVLQIKSLIMILQNVSVLRKDH